jgi:hypothetical protein
MSYYWETNLFQGAFLRFLLPAVVPGVLLALVCLNEIVRRTGGRRAIEVLVIVAFAGSLGWWGIRGTLSRVDNEYVERVAKNSMVDFITDTVPEGSVVFGHPVLLLALDADQAYTLYPYVILDKNRIRESVMNTDRPFALAMQDERAGLLEKTFCGVDSRMYLSRVQSLLETALSEGRGVFVVGEPGIIERSVWSLPVCYQFEPVAEQDWMIPAHKILSRGKPAAGGGEKTARPKEIACEIVKITRVTRGPGPVQ